MFWGLGAEVPAHPWAATDRGRRHIETIPPGKILPSAPALSLNFMKQQGTYQFNSAEGFEAALGFNGFSGSEVEFHSGPAASWTASWLAMLLSCTRDPLAHTPINAAAESRRLALPVDPPSFFSPYKTLAAQVKKNLGGMCNPAAPENHNNVSNATPIFDSPQANPKPRSPYKPSKPQSKVPPTLDNSSTSSCPSRAQESLQQNRRIPVAWEGYQRAQILGFKGLWIHELKLFWRAKEWRPQIPAP